MKMSLGVMMLWVPLVVGCATDDDDNTFDSCGDGVCAGETSASCPLDCPASGPRCGDATCNGGETAASCPADCGSSACSAAADTCTGETLCVGGACVAAFPRVYAVTNVSVSVPTLDPADGQTWDTGGGAPDLFLANSAGMPLTTAIQDQFSVSFPGPFEVTLIAGSSLRINVYDEDLTTDDYVTGCEAAPISVQLLRSRSFSCAGNGFSFTSVISPR